MEFSILITLTGNVQAELKNRLFWGRYGTEPLGIGNKKLNYVNQSLNAYFFMLRIHGDIENNSEFGISVQTKTEARAIFSDESVQILADNTEFSNDSYSDLFNTKFNYQVYHQIGFSYRRDIDKQLAFGIKLSALMGVVYNKVNINHSIINFDRPNDQAFLSLAGNYYASFKPGNFTSHDLIPSFRNPGASISFGTSYVSENKTHIQFNVKDLGFIHWNKMSVAGEFNNTGIIQGLTEQGREDSIATTASALVQSNGVQRSFTTPTDSRMEFSASKDYWIRSVDVKYSPTVILSKQLFYTGFTAALVNHFQYNNFVATLTGSYDDQKIFNTGAQFMIKSPNSEFFIGSDRILQTASLIRAGTASTSGQISKSGQFTGANFYMGFSIKFGPVLEHPHNASYIPMGDRRSFIKRFWQRITGKED